MQQGRTRIKNNLRQITDMNHSDDIETKKEIIQVLLAAAFIIIFFVFWSIAT